MKKSKHKSKNNRTHSPKKSLLRSCFDTFTAFFKSRLFFESLGIILISFSIFLAIGLATIQMDESHVPVSKCGHAGALLAKFLIVSLGLLSISFPIFLAVIGIVFFRFRQIEHKALRLVGVIFFLVAGTALSGHLLSNSPFWKDISHSAGGWLGDKFVSPLNQHLDKLGTTLTLITSILIAVTFLTGISYYRILSQTCSKIAGGFSSVYIGFKQRLTLWLKHRKKSRQQKIEQEISQPSQKTSKTGKLKRQTDVLVEPSKLPEKPFDIPEDMQSSSPADVIPIHINDSYFMVSPETDSESLEEESSDDQSIDSKSSFTRVLEYEYPDIMMLNNQPEAFEKETYEKLLAKSEKLLGKLNEFSIDGRITEISPGPIITRYEFEPAPGIKISKVISLSDDLALGMRSRFGLRVIPIPGKSALGIEIPNQNRELVNLKEILLSEEFQKAKAKSLLSLPLGRDTAGRPYISDLKRMPHLLIAGATGSGKSVCISTILAGLLFITRPKELELLLIDPKMLELSDFNGIPHLREPVITDPKITPDALNWAVSEMEERYRLLAKEKVRNIDQFNAKVVSPQYDGENKNNPLPYLVIVIDELADLMLTAASTIEDAIQRLAQMARAAGIHLIIATQRPSVDVITGVIKANLPCRLAFQVASKVDSRTILDTVGAEKLIGLGDCIFMPPGTSQLLRLHGAFISETEIKRLVEHLRHQPEDGQKESIFKSTNNPEDDFENTDDPLYNDAVRLVLSSGVASISMLQRRLRIGHSRASRLIDFMELSGIVGPHIGSKTRDILVEPDEYLGRLDDIEESGIYD